MGPIDLNIKRDRVRWEIIGIYELFSDPPDRIPGLSEAMCAAYPRSLKGKLGLPKLESFGLLTHIACLSIPEAGLPLRTCEDRPRARVVWPPRLSEAMCAAYPRSLKGKQSLPKPTSFSSLTHITCHPIPEASLPLRLRG